MPDGQRATRVTLWPGCDSVPGARSEGLDHLAVFVQEFDGALALAGDGEAQSRAALVIVHLQCGRAVGPTIAERRYGPGLTISASSSRGSRTSSLRWRIEIPAVPSGRTPQPIASLLAWSITVRAITSPSGKV